MAGGYILNDIIDIRTDKINKPEKVIIDNSIGIPGAKIAYVILSMAGLSLGLYLSHLTGKTVNYFWHPVTVLLLIIYSIYLKNSFLYGNLLISFLILIGIVIIACFDLIPATTELNPNNPGIVLNLIFTFGAFAFLLTLLREISKDAEDIEGDLITGSNTLPLRYGFKTTNKVLGFAGIATCILILTLSFNNRVLSPFFFLYLIFAVILPLVYFVYQVKNNASAKDYRKSSLFLKLIMLTGMLALLFV
jgi:4-hydroxybenzoate polyprenyltransferase